MTQHVSALFGPASRKVSGAILNEKVVITATTTSVPLAIEGSFDRQTVSCVNWFRIHSTASTLLGPTCELLGSGREERKVTAPLGRGGESLPGVAGHASGKCAYDAVSRVSALYGPTQRLTCTCYLGLGRIVLRDVLDDTSNACAGVNNA